MRLRTTFHYFLFAGLLPLLLASCTVFKPYPDQQATFEQTKWLGDNGIQLVVVGDQTRIILPADKFFHIKSSEFKPGCRYILAYIAKMLHDCKCSHIVVAGHTDEVGIAGDNQVLSEHQAYAIASYFWSMGVPWDYLHVEGHGEKLNIASNDTLQGSGWNRRIEVRMD